MDALRQTPRRGSNRVVRSAASLGRRIKARACLTPISLLAVCLLAANVAAATPIQPPADQNSPTRQPVHQKLTVAQIVLKGDCPEGPQPIDLFSPKRDALADLIARIEHAAADPVISGLILHIENPQIGWGKIHELRTAIAQFRKSGKWTVARLNLALMSDYVLATACDQIVVPPSAMLMMTGLQAEVTFYKGLLDKLGVQADLMQIGEFKGAGEPYTRNQLSPNQRRQMEAVLADYWDQIVSQVASSRKLQPEQVQAAFDEGPFTAARAKELGLIDTIAYDDELPNLLERRLDARTIAVHEDYGKRRIDSDFTGLQGMMKMINLMLGVTDPQRPTPGPKIAVIYAGGIIMPGEGLPGIFGTGVMSADTIISAIRRGAADPQVSAIVMRVDSPGGSAMASDLIWREVVRTQKPFVASMADTAASGGYYISMGADRVFAEPGTLTGSIGVVGGKVALRGFYEKLGIATETIRHGKNSGTLSLTDPFTATQRQAIMRIMNDTYEQFVSKAAEGRNLQRAQLDTLAGGRVWTGRMAAQRGLVDDVGTLADAIAAAKTMAGMRPDEQVELLPLPQPKSVFQQLLGAASQEPTAPLARTGNPLPQVLPAALHDALDQLQALGFLAQEPVWTLMPFRVELR